MFILYDESMIELNQKGEFMLFGPVFYSTINKLKNWQQLLFATTLAERMIPNYEQYCLSNKLSKTYISFLYETAEFLWEYSEHKSGVKDWNEVRKMLLKLLLPNTGNISFGEYAANSAIEGMLIAVDSILKHSGNEASNISEISINAVISYIEHEKERTLTDEEIVDNEYVQNELDFQMEVARTLQGHRSLSMFKKLRTLANNQGYSNIGICSQKNDN